ncbi:MAG: GNAT family N-acetyltransferase [Bacteroidota bacterium]|nr:GNAT family N-acetyltransferase [Bacteroidota bacterium]
MAADVIIRKATKSDMKSVLALVQELADYERASNEVIVTVADLERDGFGEKPLFGCFVAEKDQVIIGISLYYWRYSTWKGKRLYLEDIVVSEKERGHGAGKLLFERTMQEAVNENCSGMMWQVLDWNEPALNFYGKYKARIADDWLNVSLDISEIKQLLG